MLALDLGTTSLAGLLLDVEGARLSEAQLPNPQARFGSDVLRRLEAARDGHAEELQALQLTAIDQLVDRLCTVADCTRAAITAAAAAANPAITTLLRRQPAEPILFPPYRPAETAGVAFDLATHGVGGLPPLYLFPLVNGFVGGDLVAFLFNVPQPERPTLFIDVGTNAEMGLFDGSLWHVTSVAAGPAFEGEGISCGMVHAEGAITGVRASDGRLLFDVAGQGAPRGICGSGLAELIAVVVEQGLVDSHGTIVSPERVDSSFSRYLQASGDEILLQLYRDATRSLVLRQQDVRSFQLAKAAVKAGVECLLDRAGVDEEAVERVVLTGAFGFSLAPQALKRVAMLPPNMVDRVRFEPGGALSGVCRMLTTPDGRMQVETLASRLKPYPLSGTPAFEKAFIKAIDF